MRLPYKVAIAFVLIFAVAAAVFAYLNTTPTSNEECNAGATFSEGKAMECPRGCSEQSFSHYDEETDTESWGSECVLIKN